MNRNESKPRVLILYYSSLRVCGVGTWVETLAHELNRRGWDTMVGLAWGRRFHDPCNFEEFRPGLKTIRMDGRTGTQAGRIQAVERVFDRVKPNVVILTCLDAPFEAMRRLRHRGRDFRFVVINHGNLPRQAACLLHNRDIIDLAVCVSRLSYRVMSRPAKGFALERIRHIPNAVPLPVTGIRKKTATHRIGYAGRLHDDKRAADMIPFFRNVVSRCPDAELWIAGQGDREREIRALVVEHPGRVKLFGILSLDELYRSFYPSLDCFVNFSPSEGWPLSIAEAMVHGVVPVVAAYRGIRVEGLIRDGQNGRVFPVADTGRAAELVLELFGQPERMQRLRQQAADDIAGNFTLDHFGESWVAALEHCLSFSPQLVRHRPESLARRGKFGLRETYLEALRRLLRKRVSHASAGEEWPHFICRDQALIHRITREMEAEEAAC